MRASACAWTYAELHKRVGCGLDRLSDDTGLCGGEPSGNITVAVGDGHVRLRYRWTPYGQEPLEFDYQVGLDRTPCQYGGSRPWFVCPRCHSRRAVLYGTASDGPFLARRASRVEN